MKKRLLKVAICSALVVAFAVPALAASTTTTTTATTTNTTVNAFSDVPANNWAYGAVNRLAQDGVVTGYPDGTFKGDKTMTRYEMAQIIGKAMHQTMTADQKAIVDKLAREYGAELDNLGVKVDGMQRQLDNQVKISGDARVRYFNTKTDIGTTNEDMDYRARVAFDGKINHNLKFNARLSSGNQNAKGTASSNAIKDTAGDVSNAGTIKLDTANVTFNTDQLSTTVGRQDLYLGSSGYLADTQMNGLAVNLGKLDVFGGYATSNATSSLSEKVYGAQYKTSSVGPSLTADYLKNKTANTSIYGANASVPLMDGVSANAEFYKNNGDGGGIARGYGVKLDNLGLSATYRNVEGGAFSDLSTLDAVTSNALLPASGFKGMEYKFDTPIAKNTGLTVKYQDFKAPNGDKIPNRASAAVNVKF